jgi:prepilin-type N-terminal cleavage/methylation domain-containing protein
MTRNAIRRGFSLIELVIVIVIIGIIGAIAIPRMSRGSAGAADSSLTANLAILRNGIEMYTQEHQGVKPTVAAFVAEMTTYTNIGGTTNATQTGAFVYGPYIRSIPTLPVGANKGSSTVAAAFAANVGWIYTASTGEIKAGTDVAEADTAGRLYSAY